MDAKEKNKTMGRPRHFDTPEELVEAFSEYLNFCDKHIKPYTITGFCKYIKSYKDLINEYAKNEKFSGTIKAIYNIIENNVEENMLTNKYNATACIFNLKNNFGWTDKNVIEQTGPGGGPLENELTIKFIGVDPANPKFEDNPDKKENE